jgi:hypothetical protein
MFSSRYPMLSGALTGSLIGLVILAIPISHLERGDPERFRITRYSSKIDVVHDTKTDACWINYGRGLTEAKPEVCH